MSSKTIKPFFRPLALPNANTSNSNWMVLCPIDPVTSDSILNWWLIKGVLSRVFMNGCFVLKCLRRDTSLHAKNLPRALVQGLHSGLEQLLNQENIHNLLLHFIELSHRCLSRLGIDLLGMASRGCPLTPY